MQSCSDRFLDVVPNKKIVVPASLEDVRSLLSNESRMNGSYTGTQEVVTDDYYLPDDSYTAVAAMTTGLSYVWQTDVFLTENNDWSVSYANIFYCNVALETLQDIQHRGTVAEEWKDLRGQALFFRSLNFYSLMQLFSKPFKAGSVGADLGIVLKLSSDINEKIKRSTVKECIEKIIADLTEAGGLLPKKQKYKTLPDQRAAYALLARVFLSISDYENALKSAQKALSLTEGLMDYNQLPMGSQSPFSRFNKEVIFHYTIYDQPKSLTRVSSDLYSKYDASDLRRRLFFNAANPVSIDFKGSYDSGRAFFGGMATDELYLIIAECYARKAEKGKAADMLNSLVETRWDKSVTYTPVTDLDNILDVILEERRKELVFRGVRWSDLRRYVLEGRPVKSITRTIKGKTYELASDRISSYVLKIPYQVIINNQIEQNE